MQKWLISRIKCLQQLNDNIKKMHTHGDKQYTQNLFNIASNIISYRIHGKQHTAKGGKYYKELL